MSVASSSLSIAALALRDHIARHPSLDGAVDVWIGHPSSVGSSAGGARLSVFFYQVHASGSSGATGPEDAVEVIAHVLVMPVTTAVTQPGDGDSVQPGEVDLAILGHVMDRLHSNPILRIEDDGIACEIELTPHSLTPDELNKIMPSPPEGGYRPALAYQLAVLPVPLGKRAKAGRPVEIVTYGVRPEVDQPGAQFPAPREVRALTQAIAPAVQGTPWTPRLFILDEAHQPTYFCRIVSNDRPLEIPLLITGAPPGATDTEVTIAIRRWVAQECSYSDPETFVVHAKSTTVREFSALDEADRRTHAERSWSITRDGSDQYMITAERQDGGVVRGNVCILVVVREESA